MEEKSPPGSGRTRKPRSRPAAAAEGSANAAPATPRRRRAAPKNAGASETGDSSTPASSPRTESAPVPPVFDRLIDDDGFVKDFDRLASGNPKSA
ncbi:MAG TPA: hypothetical protein VE007_12570, partial [Thermoanaerobaculia bacterium]|nr:hypothetical protein [Thermoanaerobaculia bacterium]